MNGTRLLHWVPGSNDIREEDSLHTFNQRTKALSCVTKPERFVADNSLYKQMEHYGWTTGQYIYYIMYTGLTTTLTQYDPITGQITPVLFPESKGEQFVALLAIFQTDGKFPFMTKYLGK